MSFSKKVVVSVEVLLTVGYKLPALAPVNSDIGYLEISLSKLLV